MDLAGIKTLTVTYNNISNDIKCSVEVSHPASLLAEAEVAVKATFIAVWDTGATGSVITELAAKQLGLQPTGGKHVSGLGGTQYKNTYLVDIMLPNGLEKTDLSVTEIDNPTDENGNKIQPFGVLIGMDIISMGDFCVTNFEGKTVMSFRIPSLHKICYVEELNKRRSFENKTQRNPQKVGFKGKRH